MPDSKIKNRIKQLRIEQHKTQKDVASYIEMTEQAVANYETGKREPKLATWKKLADFFGVSLLYITGQSEQPKLIQGEFKSVTPYRRGHQQVVTTSLNVNLNDLIKEYRLAEHFLTPLYLSDLFNGATVYNTDGTEITGAALDELKKAIYNFVIDNGVNPSSDDQ